MFKNYITTAWRNLSRNKLYTFINIGGLAFGLAAVILIGLFVQDELNYDKWIPEAERIYKLETTFNIPGREPLGMAMTQGAAAPALANHFPGIEEAVRIMADNGITVKRDDQSFTENVFYVDDNFFRVFDLPMVAGNREEVLSKNTAVIISEDMAKKYFGGNDALGKTLIIGDDITYDVVGIFQNIPENTHFDIDFVALLDPGRVLESWVYVNNIHTYIKLRPGVTEADIEAGLPDFVAQNAVTPQPIPGLEDLTKVIEFNLIAVPDIHLHADKQGNLKPTGDYQMTMIFAGIAGLVLVIGAINFMNLATAQAMKRAREVSVRKVMGASRGQLIGQFLGEAFLTTLIALGLAAGLAELALPFYNEFLDKQLTMDYFSDPALSLGMLTIAALVALLGGAYPAFFLSNFRPLTVLRANQSSQSGAPWLRNALVVLQFAISIGLIAVTAVIYGQTIYARSFDAGFDKDHKLTVIAAGPGMGELRRTLVTEFTNLPGVAGVTTATDTLPRGSLNVGPITIPGVNAGEPLMIERMTVATNFFQLYGVQPLAGRLFSEDFRSDYENLPENESQVSTRGMIVNERFLKKAGYATSEDAIGKVVSTQNNTRTVMVTIVGVVPDLYTRSVRDPLAAMTFFVNEDPMFAMTLDIRSADLPATLAAIDRVWANVVPEQPIQRSFVDEGFDALYVAEEERARMFAGFSLFAVLVACLGLYGLAAFTAERRTMEIGVRKVMGAGVFDIVKLLNWQFLKPVLVASVIGNAAVLPMMADWLSGFRYRIDLVENAYLFVVAAAIALMIAWATVAGHAYRAARTNPIKGLRYE